MKTTKSKVTYQVLVGNIGEVYSGNSSLQAGIQFESYVKRSKAGGRSRAEEVTLICAIDSAIDVVRSYIPDSHSVPTVVYECGICGAMHPWQWSGDCREDKYRYYDVPYTTIVHSWEERLQRVTKPRLTQARMTSYLQLEANFNENR